MPLDSASELGRIIGGLSKKQQYTDENLSPEESESQLLLKNQEFVEVVGSVTFTAKFYDDNVFVLDHVVLGYLDSSTLNIDGGYADAGPEWPWSWPSISWSEDVTTSTLYTTTF